MRRFATKRLELRDDRIVPKSFVPAHRWCDECADTVAVVLESVRIRRIDGSRWVEREISQTCVAHRHFVAFAGPDDGSAAQESAE